MKSNDARSNREKQVLIVKLSSLGDLFHALPAVHNLKTGLSASIDWVVNSEYADLARCFTDVEDVIPFPRRSFVGGAKPFLSRLRKKKYDLIIDLQGLLKSAMVAVAARGERRIGPSSRRECSGALYSEVATGSGTGRHAVERNMDVIRYLGLGVVPHEFPVRFPEVKVGQSRPKVAMLPVSRWESKNWPVRLFAEAARTLHEKLGASIFTIGASDDAACREIEGALPRNAVCNMAGRTSLVQLGSLLSQMDLLISVDSGPMHLAAAIGTPVLAVFGATDPARTGPFGAGHGVLGGNLPCQPCLRRKCKFGDVRCLTAISVAQVCDAAAQMLGARRPPPASLALDDQIQAFVPILQ